MAVTDNWLSRIRGTFGQLFGIGGTAGVNVKNNSGTVEARNAADTAYADMAANRIVIHGDNATNGVVLDVPPAMAATDTYTFPAAVGSLGQFLKLADGAGTLEWSFADQNNYIMSKTAFSQANDPSVTLIASPPDNAVLRKIMINVTAAAGGGSPTLQVGTAGDPDAYMLPTENDLKTLGKYIIEIDEPLGASPADIIATIGASAQTFSGQILIDYVLP